MSLVVPQDEFQHIIRLVNTNIDGKQNVMYALTKIQGIGRRFANLALKKAEVDIRKRCGELTNEELERVMQIVQNPREYKIPDWFLNRQRDIKDGKTGDGRFVKSAPSCSVALFRHEYSPCSEPGQKSHDHSREVSFLDGSKGLS